MSRLRYICLAVWIGLLGGANGNPPKRKHYVETPPPSSDGQGGSPCRTGAMVNGQCYDFNSKKISWKKARWYCSHIIKGDLPLVQKKPVYDAILKYARDNKIDGVAWVGLKDSKIPGVLSWINYDVLEDKGSWNAFKEWNTANPITKDKKTGCVGLSLKTGKFRGYDCKTKHIPICELNFQTDENVVKKINNKIDFLNRQVVQAEKGAFGRLLEANQGIKNLYDTDIKLDAEQKELVAAGADPSTATKEIKIKPGEKPTHKQLEKAFKKQKGKAQSNDVKKGTNDQAKSRSKRAARQGETYRWPNATVPYVFDDGLSEYHKNKIINAIAVYGEKTCVKIIPRTNEVDYLYIKATEKGCWSFVGRQGELQEVNLNPDTCFAKKGTIQHEFLHSFGYWHEHTRPDRDNYVEINMENVDPEYENNFDKKPGSHTNGFEYDYGSIMQYPSWAFALDTTINTITPLKTSTAVLGQREEISELDLAELNFLYSCSAARASVKSGKWTLVTDKTSGGNANGAPCKFPFTKNGVTYNDCLDYSGGLKWCATTADYGTDKKWGECVYDKHITTYKDSGNANGADCNFPFIYNQETFYFCTMVSGNKPWCATTANYGTDHKYGHCVLGVQDGGWTDWSPWGSCTKTCGNGKQVRRRECSNPKPANGGKDCSGSSSEQQVCAKEACPISEAKYEWLGCWDDEGLPELLNTIEGTDPATGAYTTRTDKKGTCATAAESAGCRIFAVRYDGKCFGQTPGQWWQLYQGNGASNDCPASGHGSTDALDAYTLDINSPINGEWGVWSSYGGCSRTCGTGTHTRTRSCNNPGPMNGGNYCSGNSSEMKNCATGTCPVNGDYDGWTPWAADVQADSGTSQKYRYRTRQCTNPRPAHGGAQCQGDALDVDNIG